MDRHRLPVPLLAALLCGCAAPVTPGPQPAFMRVELAHLESRIADGAGGARDPDSERRLSALSCRIAPEQCSRIRVYVVDRDGPQAQLWPNGMLVVRAPLLAVIADEDETAFALAHELAHQALDHFEAGPAAAADDALERAADAWAACRLRELGYRSDAAITLLARLAQAQASPEARRRLERRLAALAAGPA